MPGDAKRKGGQPSDQEELLQRHRNQNLPMLILPLAQDPTVASSPVQMRTRSHAVKGSAELRKSHWVGVAAPAAPARGPLTSLSFSLLLNRVHGTHREKKQYEQGSGKK